MTIQDRFRNIPAYSWQLGVSDCECLSGSKEHRGWISLPWTDTLGTGSRGACSKASVLSPALSSSCCKKKMWKNTAHPTLVHEGSTWKLTEKVKAAEWRLSPAVDTSHIPPKPQVTWVATRTTNPVLLASLSLFTAQQQQSFFFTSLFFT